MLGGGARTEFLSTPSARRATPPKTPAASDRVISIHALREEGDRCPQPAHLAAYKISIHALREEGDGYIADDTQYIDGISIHALREEGDAAATKVLVTPT